MGTPMTQLLVGFIHHVQRNCAADSGTQWSGKAGICLALALASGTAWAQQKAGELTHLQGMATAQQPGSAFRFLGRGDAVLEGDIISTTEKGFAVITLGDGTKFTLRPATTFAIERYNHDQGTENALMRLFKGGMRLATGLIGKRNPGGLEVRTAVATIGIRGTSFDARICGADCREESSGAASRTAQISAGATGVTQAPVVARVVQATGEVSAALPGQPRRPLSVGGSLYEGDDLRTGPGATVVIGFKDQSKVSLNPETVLRIDAYVYDRPQASDSMTMALLKGGLRLFTGLMGKKSPQSVQVQTVISTVGIRGTGMDISCEGHCVDPSLGAGEVSTADPANPRAADGLFMLTWDGATFFAVGPLDVPLDRAGFIGRDGAARLLDQVPDFLQNLLAPRPDRIEVDWNNLFATVEPSGNDGLYVVVREGHVFLLSGDSRIDLGVGEAGYVGREGSAQRIAPSPGFMLDDPFPLPERFSQSDGQVFQLFGVTLGRPGQEICRL